MEEIQPEIQTLLNFPKYRIPLFSFNPNSFPYVLTYDQPTVIMDGKTLVSLETDGIEETANGDCGAKIRTRVKFSINLEKNSNEVKEVLIRGCFCLAKNCFFGLDPESVYRHRLNISMLNKEEHNMFLMGAVLSCLTNRKGPIRRSYIKYSYKGKRVCKEVFLYLHCCTHQQLSEIRDHLMTRGVSSPVQFSNYGSVKQGLFYKQAMDSMSEFLAKYMEEHVGKDIKAGEYIFLPLGITKKSLHQAYKVYIQKYIPGLKCMAYSTFRNFLVTHFPHIVFYKFGNEVIMLQAEHKNEEIKTVTVKNEEVPSQVAAPSQIILFENEAYMEGYDVYLPLMYTDGLENCTPVNSENSDENVTSDI